jgi:hypothetical protein
LTLMAPVLVQMKVHPSWPTCSSFIGCLSMIASVAQRRHCQRATGGPVAQGTAMRFGWTVFVSFPLCFFGYLRHGLALSWLICSRDRGDLVWRGRSHGSHCPIGAASASLTVRPDCPVFLDAFPAHGGSTSRRLCYLPCSCGNASDADSNSPIDLTILRLRHMTYEGN